MDTKIEKKKKMGTDWFLLLSAFIGGVQQVEADGHGTK